MTVAVALAGRLPDVAGVDRWLHAGEDAAWRIAAESSGPLAGLPRLETADALQEKAWTLRRPFLDCLGELGVRNDSAEWWASQLGARTSFTRLYDRVCLLAVLLELLDDPPEQTTLVVCSSAALAAEVARAGAVPAPSPPAPPAGPSSTASCARGRASRPGRSSRCPASSEPPQDLDPRYRRRVLARHGLLAPRPFGGPHTALLFTWIDRRSFAGDGGYVDPHFGPLAELLRGRGLEVAFAARVLPGMPFAEAVDRLRVSGETFVFPDAHVTPEDHRDCARRAAAFAPAIPDDAAVEDVPLAALARELVEAERPAQAGALALEPLLRSFARDGVHPERVVHTYEGHPWELVLARAAAEHLPETAVIGYENLNMSRLSLSMFPAQDELAVRPLPGRIVANGPAYRDVLAAEGVPEERLRTGCGLRHRALWSAPARTGSPGGPLRLLAATEIALGPSAELVEKAAAAFGGDPGYELVVKAHPLVSRAELARAVGRRGGTLRFDERPTLELLGEADVLLYTYTGVSFEALALGVPPVFVRSESTLDLDQLEFAADLRWSARTVDELRAAVAEIAALDLEAWRPRARAAAERAIAPVLPACVEAFL